MKTDENIKLQNIYKFLALSMRYPEPSWCDDGYLSNCRAIMHEAGHFEDAWDLEEALAKSHDFLEDLQLEYTRLFINAPGGVSAPPFGSVYLEGDRSLYGLSTEKVKAFYREQNFFLADPLAVPDALSMELDFLSLLVAGKKFHKEEEFLSKYFRPWFSKFRDIVVGESQHPFYVGIIKLIDLFTSKEDDS